MGNLEKAGVLVVVALLAVILVVAFLNFPDQPHTPVLGASIGKQSQLDTKKAAKPKTEPANILPDGPDVIRPKPDTDRPSTDAAPRLVNDPMGPISNIPTTPVKKDSDLVVVPTPPAPKTEPPVQDPPKKPASPYPKTVKVQAGENLWGIAVREYGPKLGPKMVPSITEANPKIRAEALKAGTEVTLPAPPSEVAAAPTTGDSPAKPVSSNGAKSEKPAKEGSTPPKTTRKLPFIPE